MIVWNSTHISDIFNCYHANINGMWNARKLDRITYEFILTQNIDGRYAVNQQLIALNLDSASISKVLVTEFATV